jgi:oxalate decarboxylase/phosphoglucose isomerase-like protein (cupin superfamily)
MKPFTFHDIDIGLVTQDYSQKQFATPFKCEMIVELSLPKYKESKFLLGESHIAHDDYLRVISGELIILILHNKIMHYIPLSARQNKLVQIPTQTWHVVVNISDHNCHYQNWMKVWKNPTKADYKPVQVNHCFDLELAKIAISSNIVQPKNFKD